MQVKPNSAYLTQCGYVVQLDHNQRGHVPVLTTVGMSSQSMNGFHWKTDGTIEGFDEEWTKKLCLVEELNFSLPTVEDLPDGYDFVEGMEFREPKSGDLFLNINCDNKFVKSLTICPHSGYTAHYNGRRFILRRKTVSGVSVKIDDNEPLIWSAPYTYNASISAVDLDAQMSAIISLQKSSGSVYPNVEKIMSKNVGSYVWSATKFVGRLVKRAINYQFVEPIKIVGAKILRTVRYVTLAAMISGGTYTYYQPAEAVSFFKSLLPSISISFEKPDIMKG